MSEASQPQEPDFVDRALHSFDHVLDLVHDRVVRPILLVGRAIAFGIIILMATLVLVSVLIIGLIRLMDVYLFAGHEWLSYLVMGGLSLVTGLIIWRRRRPVNLRK